jgi:hypothetical protein
MNLGRETKRKWREQVVVVFVPDFPVLVLIVFSFLAVYYY